MAFTAGELASIANASLDWYFEKGKVFLQDIQKKPLLDLCENKKKTFPGGKGDISLGVKGVHGDGSGNDVVSGFTHSDAVNFYTPANLRRAVYPWREHHIGLTLTHTELKIDGISVIDTNGSGTSNHSQREKHVLINLFKDKMEDLGEQYARGMNDLLWGDGTVDPLALAGMRSIITDNPTVGTVGGIDRATATWWRNLAATTAHGAAGGQGPITSAVANGGALATYLQGLHRQLIRYGGTPDAFLAGSDFITALETEMRANGYYSDSGFTRGGDLAVGQMVFKGVPVKYDPTLDDLGRSKFGYWWDTNAIFLDAMENEWRKQHTPSRPHDQFVLYRSIVSTGQMVSRRCNSSAVIQIV